MSEGREEPARIGVLPWLRVILNLISSPNENDIRSFIKVKRSLKSGLDQYWPQKNKSTPKV